MAAATAETMVADVGGVAPEGSLLMDEPLLEKADESTTHAVGSGSFTNWLAENEKSAMYALARLPALHIVFWVVTLCVIGPKYFPTQTETVLSMYFGYALPRFCVILVSGSLACYWCVRRNAETATATFSDRVAPTSEMALGPCLRLASNRPGCQNRSRRGSAGSRVPSLGLLSTEPTLATIKLSPPVEKSTLQGAVNNLSPVHQLDVKVQSVVAG